MDRTPALKMFLLFSLGILVASAVSVPIVFAVPVALIFLLLTVVFRSQDRISQVWLALLVIAAGYLGYQIRTAVKDCQWQEGRPQIAMVQVVSEPQSNEGRYRFTAQVLSYLDSSDVWQPADFKLLARTGADPEHVPQLWRNAPGAGGMEPAARRGAIPAGSTTGLTWTAARSGVLSAWST